MQCLMVLVVGACCSPDSIDFFDGRYYDPLLRPSLSITFGNVGVKGQSVDTTDDYYEYYGDVSNNFVGSGGGGGGGTSGSTADSSTSFVGGGGVSARGAVGVVAAVGIALVAAGIAVHSYRRQQRLAVKAATATPRTPATVCARRSAAHTTLDRSVGDDSTPQQLFTAVADPQCA